MNKPLDKSLQQLASRVIDAAAAGPVHIQGGGTRGFYGNPVTAKVGDDGKGAEHGSDPGNNSQANAADSCLQLVSTTEHQGIISYVPEELMIRVKAGTRLSEVKQLLAENHQHLAFEPPLFGEPGTLGGMVATGISGSRRPYAGAVRDFVLGVGLVNAEGDYQEYGGQVMKNVAGYDVSRLLVGSQGVLGLLADITFKVLPKPQDEVTLHTQLPLPDALALFEDLRRQGVAITGAAAGRALGRLVHNLPDPANNDSGSGKQAAGSSLGVLPMQVRQEDYPAGSATGKPLADMMHSSPEQANNNLGSGEQAVNSHLEQGQTLAAQGDLHAGDGPSIPNWGDITKQGDMHAGDGCITLVRLSAAGKQVSELINHRGAREVNNSCWAQIDCHHAFLPGSAYLWRLSCTPGAKIDQPFDLIDWGGAQRWLASSEPMARPHAQKPAHWTLVRVPSQSGHASNVAGNVADMAICTEEPEGGRFQPLPAALMKLHQRIKHTFDPRGRFNPGRLYPSL